MINYFRFGELKRVLSREDTRSRRESIEVKILSKHFILFTIILFATISDFLNFYLCNQKL